MNFLLDENFPKAAQVVLEKLGHEVFDFDPSRGQSAAHDG